MPHAVDKGTFSIGSLIIPAIILLVIWLIKRNAEKKLNKDVPQKVRENKVVEHSVITNLNQSPAHTPNNPLKEFSRQFSKEQKAVIIWFLVKIAEADGDINGREEELLAQTINMIEFDSSDKETESISLKISTYSLAELVHILNTLDRPNKEWFAVTTYSLIMCDGAAKDDEVGMAIYVCSQIGINEQEYYKIIDKAKSLYNHINL